MKTKNVYLTLAIAAGIGLNFIINAKAIPGQGANCPAGVGDLTCGSPNAIIINQGVTASFGPCSSGSQCNGNGGLLSCTSGTPTASSCTVTFWDSNGHYLGSSSDPCSGSCPQVASTIACYSTSD